eukprot:7148598-Alexandrium_andersonii.AAC.1
MSADLPHEPPGERAQSPDATTTLPSWLPSQLALCGRSHVLPSAMRADAVSCAGLRASIGDNALELPVRAI